MKLAFIGTGKIVHDALGAVKDEAQIEKTAIFARPHSLEKAQALAKEHGIAEVWTDYDELLEKTQADTVYIGLINSAHYPYAKKALQQGKHVILEKPFTPFLEEAEELLRLAEEKDLCIFEAITVLHSDMIKEMEKNLPKLGKLRMALCNYSQYSSRYDDYRQGKAAHAFDPAYYGGALYDINVYNLHYCATLLGSPKEVSYHANLGFNGIDTSGTLVLTYPGFCAVCTGAKDSDSPCYIQIQGEDGWMRLEGKPNSPSKLVTVYVNKEDSTLTKDASGAMVRSTLTETYEPQPVPHRMTPEFRNFAAIIDGKTPEHRKEYQKLSEETLEVVRVLELARKSAGIEFPETPAD